MLPKLPFVLQCRLARSIWASSCYKKAQFFLVLLLIFSCILIRKVTTTKLHWSKSDWDSRWSPPPLWCRCRQQGLSPGEPTAAFHLILRVTTVKVQQKCFLGSFWGGWQTSVGDGSSDDTLPGKRSGSSSLPPADGPLWTGRKKKNKKNLLSFLQYILVLLFFVCLPPQPSPPPNTAGTLCVLWLKRTKSAVQNKNNFTFSYMSCCYEGVINDLSLQRSKSCFN